MPNQQREAVKLMVSIVDRGRGEHVAEVFDKNAIHFNFVCCGAGTVSSEVLNLLGLGTSDKDVIVSLVPSSQVLEMLRALDSKMRLKLPGRGIAFTLPLSGINALIAHTLTQDHNEQRKEDAPMAETVKYGLIVALINPGYIDQVMEVARLAGATGGTVLHARGIGKEDKANFFGMSINSEKEIVTILASQETKPAIMDAINRLCGLKKPSQAIVFSLPVHDMVGLG